MRKKETSSQIEEDLFGLEPEMSLQNVNFASAENSFLNEHYQEDAEEI